MSQQAMDLRRSVQIVRRHKILVGIAAGLGLLIGAACAALDPPMLTSTALVALPQPAQSAQATASGAPYSYTATQEVIAGRNQVLLGALPNARPAMSLDELRDQVQIGSPAPYVISVGAKGNIAADVEATANAVAHSYIHYIGSASSPIGHVTAHLFQPATSVARTAPVKQLLVDALLGAVCGALIGVILALAVNRTDRRLVWRDEIAKCLEVPVLGSFPVSHPTGAAGWTKLMEDYEPKALDAWHLRNALHQLGMAGFSPNYDNAVGSSSVAVLSLSSDPKALAVGPELAIFAASLGIPSALVIGPQQDTGATVSLRTACAVPPPTSSKRPSQLRVTADDGNHVNGQPDAVLTVVVAVVDDQTPRMPETIRTTSTVLGVSAGAATADQLARAASSAAADGREIAGILVADPEPTDRTTGRIPQPPWPG